MFESREVAGSAKYKQQVKRCEIVLSFKVSLFILFIQSWKQREFVYSGCLRSDKIFLF